MKPTESYYLRFLLNSILEFRRKLEEDNVPIDVIDWIIDDFNDIVMSRFGVETANAFLDGLIIKRFREIGSNEEEHK